MLFIWLKQRSTVFHRRGWIDRRAKLDQCLELQLFNRDCEQAENWMAAREASLRDEVDGSSEGVESLIKKHEDFDRAINSQEEKINMLVQFADQLKANDHYDTDGIDGKKQQVLDRCVTGVRLKWYGWGERLMSNLWIMVIFFYW